MIAERIAACRDPTDDKFLELAVNGYADLIVSGDRDLFALNPFGNIPIITPAAFVPGGGAVRIAYVKRRCSTARLGERDRTRSPLRCDGATTFAPNRPYS